MIAITADKTAAGIVIKKILNKYKTSIYTKADRAAVIIVHFFQAFAMIWSPF